MSDGRVHSKDEDNQTEEGFTWEEVEKKAWAAACALDVATSRLSKRKKVADVLLVWLPIGIVLVIALVGAFVTRAGVILDSEAAADQEPVLPEDTPDYFDAALLLFSLLTTPIIERLDMQIMQLKGACARVVEEIWRSRTGTGGYARRTASTLASSRLPRAIDMLLQEVIDFTPQNLHAALVENTVHSFRQEHDVAWDSEAAAGYTLNEHCGLHRYLSVRTKPTLRSLQAELVTVTRRGATMFAVMLVTICASFAAIGVGVPLHTTLFALVNAMQTLRPAFHDKWSLGQALSKLQNALMLASSLADVQQRDPANMEVIVRHTEATIRTLSPWYGGELLHSGPQERRNELDD